MRDYLFAEGLLLEVLTNLQAKVKEEIQRVPQDYLLQVSESDFCESVIAKYRLDAPTLLRDKIHALEPTETRVDVSQDFARAIFDRSRPAYITGTAITVVIPFDGDGELFKFRPSSYTLNPPRGNVHGQELHLTYTTAGHDAEAMKRSYEQALVQIERYLTTIRAQVEEFNARTLPTLVRDEVARRKKKLLADAGMASALGIPIKRRQDAGLTFAPPQIRRKPAIRRPEVKPGHFVPEPALPNEEYEYILNVIENMILVMERSPRAFARLDEESLRDHILVQLNGHYEGMATGETFNAEGKTDILIRYEGKNVFIAECKFWDGPKELLSAITQLLGYTSWRDTKIALLIFNRRKGHSAVLEKIAETVPQHECHKRDLGTHGETQFRYVFHQSQDPNREVVLTVLAFDVPSSESGQGP